MAGPHWSPQPGSQSNSQQKWRPFPDQQVAVESPQNVSFLGTAEFILAAKRTYPSTGTCPLVPTLVLPLWPLTCLVMRSCNTSLYPMIKRELVQLSFLGFLVKTQNLCSSWLHNMLPPHWEKLSYSCLSIILDLMRPSSASFSFPLAPSLLTAEMLPAHYTRWQHLHQQGRGWKVLHVLTKARLPRPAQQESWCSESKPASPGLQDGTWSHENSLPWWLTAASRTWPGRYLRLPRV